MSYLPRAVGATLFAVVSVAGLVVASPAAARPAKAHPAKARPAVASSAQQIQLGAFAGSDEQFGQLETDIGADLGIASSYQGWGDVFPDAAELSQSAAGHTLLVSWDLGSTADTRFSTFPAHDHDAYLAQEAAAARSYGKPLYIRPWPEMNADWTAFQPTADGSRPAGGTYQQFITAWRYLVTFFRAHGATNVRWVFNPTTDTYAQTTPVAKIWPGSRYVDVLGLDGFNWGNGGILQWRSFADIYTTQYNRLVALAPDKPVWICEVGSKEPLENDGAPSDPSHSKADWYTGMVGFLAHSKVSAVVLFNVEKERDWRVESDPGALAVVRQFAQSAAVSRPT